MASSSGTKDDVGPPRSLSKRLTRALTVVDPSDENSPVDSELVPSSLAFIAPILRVANEIENDNPRVAYLCKILNWTKWRCPIIFGHECKFVCLCCYSLWFRVYDLLLVFLEFPLAILSWFGFLGQYWLFWNCFAFLWVLCVLCVCRVKLEVLCGLYESRIKLVSKAISSLQTSYWLVVSQLLMAHSNFSFRSLYGFF